MAASRIDILHAYRHLLRASLEAAKRQKPARYVLLARLRSAFRTSPASAYDATKLSRTLMFLNNARDQNHLEHRVLRNLTFYWWQDVPTPLGPKVRTLSPEMKIVRKDAMKDVDDVLKEMGRTMDMVGENNSHLMGDEPESWRDGRSKSRS